MSDKAEACTIVKDKRENVCPVAEKMAIDAAEKGAKKAVNDVFAAIGYNLDDPEDIKKLTLLFNAMEKWSAYAEKGKMVTFVVFVTGASVWLGKVIWASVTKN